MNAQCLALIVRCAGCAVGLLNKAYLGLVDNTVHVRTRKPLSADVADGWWAGQWEMRGRDLRPVDTAPITVLHPASDFEWALVPPPSPRTLFRAPLSRTPLLLRRNLN